MNKKKGEFPKNNRKKKLTNYTSTKDTNTLAIVYHNTH